LFLPVRDFRVVEEHSGRMAIEDQPGQGMTFIVHPPWEAFDVSTHPAR